MTQTANELSNRLWNRTTLDGSCEDSLAATMACRLRPMYGVFMSSASKQPGHQYTYVFYLLPNKQYCVFGRMTLTSAVIAQVKRGPFHAYYKYPIYSS